MQPIMVGQAISNNATAVIAADLLVTYNQRMSTNALEAQIQ
jgi:hypothetical protein